MFPRFIYVVTCISTSFLFMAEKHSIVWMYYLLFIHQLVDIWVFTPPPFFLANINNAAVNTCVQVFISSGHIPRNRIAGSYDSSAFHFFRTYRTIFHSRCTIWQSQMMYECSNFSISSPTIVSVFMMIAFLVGVIWIFLKEKGPELLG